jgi:hypothetical protein
MLVNFTNYDEWNTFYKVAGRYVVINDINKMILNGFNYIKNKNDPVLTANVVKDIVNVIATTELIDLCNSNDSKIKSFIKGCIISKGKADDQCVAVLSDIRRYCGLYRDAYLNQSK